MILSKAMHASAKTKARADVACLGSTEIMNTTTQRFYAALSFMLAGFMPGICRIFYDLARQGQPGDKLLLLLAWYIIIPGILAAIFGYLIGGAILNPDEVKSRRHAARGLCVSVAAWLTFALILTVAAGGSVFFSFFNMLFLILFFWLNYHRMANRGTWHSNWIALIPAEET